MNKELQQKLYDKYPLIFAEKDLPMDQTCMCWGIDCGDGWYELLDALCSELTNLHHNTGLIVKACQVKEKFGTLRFYTNRFVDDKMVKMIDGDWHLVAYRDADGKLIKYTKPQLCDDGRDHGVADGAINMAESMSSITCELCGASRAKLRGGGWLVTWCDECYEKEQAEKRRAGGKVG